ncbi:MAG: protein phosphatase 2C domain-containing protein [Pseudomonadota bacterium]
MWRLPEPRYDVASAISQGQRDYQEDALVTDFPVGDDCGFVVLADGMGGHAAGDVASKLVVTEVYGALKRQSGSFISDTGAIPNLMNVAAAQANSSIRDHVKTNPNTHGMGATLVSLVLVGDQMYWNSIGDSPLYLLRRGKMSQLNEDHSMAPQIDFMVQSGLLDAESARNHPDRNCLTSVIFGDKVAKVDCPTKPYWLVAGDIIVLSSDGLQYLDEPRIERLLNKNRRRSAAEIASILLNAVEDLQDPDQDNISISIIKVNHTQSITKRQSGASEKKTTSATRMADKSKLAEYAQALFSSGKKAEPRRGSTSVNTASNKAEEPAAKSVAAGGK